MKTVTIWVVALLVVIGAGIGVETTTKSFSSTIDHVALRAAAAAGDPHPSSVTWVELDVPASTGYWTGMLPPFPAGLGYIMEVRGKFAIKGRNWDLDGPTPFGPSSGPILWVFVSASTLAIVREDAQSGWEPLTTYGQPDTDSLIGIVPS